MESEVSNDRVAQLRESLFGDSLTPDEVAQILGLDRTTILRYLREGRVKGYQVGREWRVSEVALRSYVEDLKGAGV